MATEVNQALAAHAQELLDEAAGRGQRAIDQVEADLEELARLRDFPSLLAGLAAMAAFTGADKAGELEQVEGELFFVGTMVEQQPQVRSALTNPGLPVENKRALVADLLDGRAGRRAAALADLLVELYEG